MKKLALITMCALLVLGSSAWPPSFAQGRGGNAAQNNAPSPRWPDGHINLGPVPGGAMGLWEATPTDIPLARPDTATDFGLFAATTREPTDPFMAAKPKLSQIPFQPWA